MIFQLQITVQSIEEAERILASLKHSADPAVVQQVGAQINPVVESGEVNPKVDPAAAEKPKNPRGRPRRQVAEPVIGVDTGSPDGDCTVRGHRDENGVVHVGSVEYTTPVPQTYTRDDVRQALMDLQSKTPGDMTGALAMLEKFNAGRVSEVQDADFAKFIDACKAA